VSIAVLGPITFEVNADKVRTWQDARRTAAARWHQHDVYQGKPVKEFIGPGLAKINLSVRLDINRGVVPRDELRQMRAQMDAGTPLQFTVGGDLVGDFTLEGVNETWRDVNGAGVLMVALVDLTLEEYL
jgi:phage protein U